ncbi:MAG: bifunctional DNA primase/polymerase [Atopobiaceae bacterium]|nr:bifunctional DNA primase/polymerase [Atopobiaceae bacterium]
MLPSPTGQAANDYAERGLAVWAPAWGSKVPNKGTSGILGRTTATATHDLDALAAIYDEKPQNNVAIRLEMCEPMLVSVDCDDAKAHPTAEEKASGTTGEDGWTVLDAWLSKESVTLQPTWTIRTATDGINRLYRLPDGASMPKDAVGAMTRVDLLGDGHAQIMPPSVIKGKSDHYHWEDGLSPDDVELAQLPMALLGFWNQTLAEREEERKRERREKAEQRKIDALENGSIPLRQRNKRLFSYGCSLRSRGADEDEVREKVRDANARRCEVPLDDCEVDRIIESVLKFPPGSKRGKFDPITQGEIALYMRGDDAICGKFGQNVLDGGYYVHGKLPWTRSQEYRRWNDADEAYLFTYAQEKLGTFSREDVRGAFKIICAENQFNPIADMLDGLPEWDGKPHAQFMLWALFGAELNEYARVASELWMRGAVRRAYESGCKFDDTLVLKGGQGVKKSMAGRRLAMREEFFCETVTDITNAKTTSEQIGGKWIVELGELSGIKGKVLEAVKAALTAQKITVRPAYGYFPIDQPRSCAFIATTNEHDFLTDKTGNRRFLPVDCAVSQDRMGWDVTMSSEIMDFIGQAWAEIVFKYKDAKAKAETEDEFLELYPMMFDDEMEELANAQREASSVEDTRIGVIETWLERQQDNIPARVCTRMIAEEALRLDDEALERNKYVMTDIAQNLDNFFPDWVRNEK